MKYEEFIELLRLLDLLEKSFNSTPYNSLITEIIRTRNKLIEKYNRNYHRNRSGKEDLIEEKKPKDPS